MELWRGTMRGHSIVAYRSDVNRTGVKFPFDDDRWPSYIPLRLPTTICVQERLPAGAAGVLINQTHFYTDLIMPIDPTEKRLFDAIDGNRSIGDIMKKIFPSSQAKSQLEITRNFFEKLWCYDQIVFDASLRQAREEET